MKKSIVFFVLIIFLFSACNYPAQTTADTNQVETQVAIILTAAPSSTATTIQPTLQATKSPTLAPKATQTETPTSTSTPTVTPSPTTTFTPQPSDPAFSLGPASWINGNDWKGFYFDDSGSEIHYSLSGNDLVLSALHANGWHGWSLTYIKGTNFYLEGTFFINSCAGLDRYGLVFRSPDTSQGYFFGVSCDGQYSLRKWVAGGFSDDDIIPWTLSTQILAGSNQENRLGVMANGNSYSLYVNGQLIATTSDDTFVGDGVFGAYIASINTPDLTVDVKSMKFWNRD